jgi:hypothetical protein
VPSVPAVVVSVVESSPLASVGAPLVTPSTAPVAFASSKGGVSVIFVSPLGSSTAGGVSLTVATGEAGSSGMAGGGAEETGCDGGASSVASMDSRVCSDESLLPFLGICDQLWLEANDASVSDRNGLFARSLSVSLSLELSFICATLALNFPKRLRFSGSGDLGGSFTIGSSESVMERLREGVSPCCRESFA